MQHGFLEDNTCQLIWSLKHYDYLITDLLFFEHLFPNSIPYVCHSSAHVTFVYVLIISGSEGPLIPRPMLDTLDRKKFHWDILGHDEYDQVKILFQRRCFPSVAVSQFNIAQT